MTLYSKVDSAIDKGINFIKSRQSADGLWRDFDTLAGNSSDWVSGFVCYAIYDPNNLNEIIFPTLKQLIFRQRPNGGWSYNKKVPTDCDSSSMVMLALSASNILRPSLIERALHYIKLHYSQNMGGFMTYNPQDGIHKFIQKCESNTNGWYSAHCDVTSLAVQILMLYGISRKSEIVQKSCMYLINQRNNNHVIWKSYWWKGYAYSTYNALKTLLICGCLKEKEMIETIDFLSSNQLSDNGWNDSFDENSEVFATSLIILCLLLYPCHRTLCCSEKGIEWLITQQNSDGSWPVSPILKIPPPMVIDADTVEKWRYNQTGTGVIIEDKRSIFTSSAAIWALKLFRSII